MMPGFFVAAPGRGGIAKEVSGHNGRVPAMRPDLGRAGQCDSGYTPGTSDFSAPGGRTAEGDTGPGGDPSEKAG